jgi:hypothetical protein
MPTIDDLREALVDQERHAPDDQAVLAELLSGKRERAGLGSRPAWIVGGAVAAAVAAIVVTVNMLPNPHAAPPRATVAGAPSSAMATATDAATVTTTHVSPPSSIVRPPSRTTGLSTQRQNASAPQRATSSAQATAATTTVRQGTSPWDKCFQATVLSQPATTPIDASVITKAVTLCAEDQGLEPGYTVQWVQTTAGALSEMIYGDPQGGAQPIIAVKVVGVFMSGGQTGRTDTMMLVLSQGTDHTPLKLYPGDSIDLTGLGIVHTA